MLLPSAQIRIDEKRLKGLIADYLALDDVFSVGVSVEGKAADYALVWEWGNLRQTKQGPKTVLGTNPDGKQVWLSSQAPYGYIRRSIPTIINLLNNEWDKFDAAKNVAKEMDKLTRHMADGMAETISEAAPMDSGQLREEIRPVYRGDELLGSAGNKYETMFLSE